ncbi:MAG: hypothetical protein H6741_27105 [Alphaproteobacteria bacterium]|nr:hypothetical protein [Alphaproteobacteria bacterium]MCB9796381.1 hypothetical protein [Alphaproteobacteria bacterium]
MPDAAPRTPLLLLVALCGACVDNTFVERPFDDIAVVTGDFDHIESSLDRMVIPYQRYEGFICCAAYDPDIDPDGIQLKVEGLFAEVDGNPELFGYDALFLNSGTRGLGDYVYNGIEDDDGIVADPERVDVIRRYVEERNRVLVVSDWAYDIVEAIWPDAIDFYGEDTALDAAQVGSPGRVQADVFTEGLRQDLETEAVSLHFNYGNWAVMEDVGPDVEVLMRGDVELRLSDEQGTGSLEDVPLLVKFSAGGGTVMVSGFHWSAQTAAMADTVLTSQIERLQPNTAEDTPTDTAEAGDAG